MPTVSRRGPSPAATRRAPRPERRRDGEQHHTRDEQAAPAQQVGESPADDEERRVDRLIRFCDEESPTRSESVRV